MKKGFVLGKFMPLHNGHLALVNFALDNCDLLYIVLCYTKEEPIPGNIRLQWLMNETRLQSRIEVIPFEYDSEELENTSISSRTVSEAWAKALRKIVPDADIVFTSEPYGNYLAEFMNIEHMSFDESRLEFPVSASEIRETPFKYWSYIAPAARSYFVKKIVLVGTESTGKSTLTQKLASYYNTAFVPEMARDIVEKTEECSFEDLKAIAIHHANEIINSIPVANKLLFVDTDLLITQSYASFLFKKQLDVESWITDANNFDLYLFLNPDCEFVQDNTRLPKDERDRLSSHHKQFILSAGKQLVFIGGDWEERHYKAIQIIDELFFKKKGWH